jgi:TPR repeat protein
MSPASHQGHIGAAALVGGIYGWGQGVAVDYARSMAAYKVGAEGGDARCQFQAGMMYHTGRGVDVDYKQARAWLEKAAAQDLSDAVAQLGTMYSEGQGVTPSWRRAREYYERAIELGCSRAVKNMQKLTTIIQKVTSQRSNHTAPSSLLRERFHTPSPSLFPHAHRPSWTSGWRSTARAART